MKFEMKILYKLWINIVLAGILVACDTKQDVWNTGICSPYHDCSIMEYLRGDDYNWELTVELIERAELTDLFEGQVDSLPEITFWGFPSYAVLRYLYDNKLESVDEIAVTTARELVLMHVMKGRVLTKDIAKRNEEYYIYEPEQTGGTDLYTLMNSHLKAYVDVDDYAYVPDGGASHLFLYSFTKETMIPLSSPDIQPLNGVVHALNYNYVLGKI
jgi:putative lipoprotein